MKKLILFAVAALVAVNVASADDKKAPKKGQRGPGLLKALELTKEQQTKFAALNKEMRGKMAELKELPKDQQRTKRQEISKARMEGLKKILNEEQLAKLKEMQTKRRPGGKGKKKPQDK
ncbi:MAG: hypothetical protein CMO74_00605 [Verrucomicrobiales bacterium]|nr:hypothetical protein [Verrucomicrobiales bacterium]|tara:strand:- start:1484 stop:1840 length:357 start_codon:yes stop_codon:yes gene_type:complete